MGLLVDIRKLDLDSWLNKLVDASKIKKTWYGKTVDNYWTHLNEITLPITTDFNAHIFSDLLTFLLEDCGVAPGLDDYSQRLSAHRGSAVFLFGLGDKGTLLQQLNKPGFLDKFEAFSKALNDAYYDYGRDELSETVTKFTEVVYTMDNQYGLMINVG